MDVVLVMMVTFTKVLKRNVCHVHQLVNHANPVIFLNVLNVLLDIMSVQLKVKILVQSVSIIVQFVSMVQAVHNAPKVFL